MPTGRGVVRAHLQQPGQRQGRPGKQSQPRHRPAGGVHNREEQMVTAGEVGPFVVQRRGQLPSAEHPSRGRGNHHGGSPPGQAVNQRLGSVEQYHTQPGVGPAQNCHQLPMCSSPCPAMPPCRHSRMTGAGDEPEQDCTAGHDQGERTGTDQRDGGGQEAGGDAAQGEQPRGDPRSSTR
jgi:hypothetical protein